MHPLAAVRRVLPVWFCLVALCAARADTISLAPVADAGLQESVPAINTGIAPNLIAGTINSGFRARMLVKFDLAGSLPAGSIINSVSFSLFDVSSPAGVLVPSNFELRRVLVDWNEGTKNGLIAADGEVTWNAAKHNQVNWAAPGGAAGTDFSGTSSGSKFVDTALITNVWASTAGMVADVQSWLDLPAANFGWIILSDNEAAPRTARRWASREDSLGRGPRLLVDYTVIPEPGAVALTLLGVGLAGATARRRNRSTPPAPPA
jgi:hypothetical protein